MKITLFRTILSTISFLLLEAAITNTCQAQGPLISASQEAIKSILLLRIPGTRKCGTAILLPDGRALTNSHVIRSLCPNRKCLNLEILQSSSPDSSPTVKLSHGNKITVYDNPVFDYAFLATEWKDPLPQSPFSLSSAPLTTFGEQVYSLGYPGCRNLRFERGTIHKQTPLHLVSSIKGSYGSSGSPLFDERYRIIGVTSQATSLLAALISPFSPFGFETNAIRADLISRYEQESNFNRQVEFSTEKLLEWYRHSIRVETGVRRAISGHAFMSAVSSLKQDALLPNPSNPDLWPFLLIGGKLDYLRNVSMRPEDNTYLRVKLLELVTASNIEYSGPYIDSLTRLTQSDLQSLADRNSLASYVDVNELISYAIKDNYPGLDIFLTLGVVKLVTLTALLSVLWVLSVTHVFKSVNGGTFRKVILAFIFGALLWPASLLLLWGLSYLR